MNDRGDDAPEGALKDVILEQLGKFQRAMIVYHSQADKFGKAREGKVMAGRLVRWFLDRLRPRRSVFGLGVY